VGFSTELLFLVMLGLVVMSPKRLNTVLEHVARAKAQFEEVSRGGAGPHLLPGSFVMK
jgi:Sec-independent protein translocase protein TatA